MSADARSRLGRLGGGHRSCALCLVPVPCRAVLLVCFCLILFLIFKSRLVICKHVAVHVAHYQVCPIHGWAIRNNSSHSRVGRWEGRPSVSSRQKCASLPLPQIWSPRLAGWGRGTHLSANPTWRLNHRGFALSARIVKDWLGLEKKKLTDLT